MIKAILSSHTFMPLQTDHFAKLCQQYQETGTTVISKQIAAGWSRQIQRSGLYGDHLVLLELKETSSANH